MNDESAEMLDRELLKDIIESMDANFDAYDIEMPSNKKAEFILLLYDHFATETASCG